MVNTPQILFRSDLSGEAEAELEIAARYFPVIRQRTEAKLGTVIIPRYSSLPYYKELEIDIKNRGSKLINSTEQHNYIANFEYYGDVQEFTPKTWFDVQSIIKDGYTGPFVLKGKTNSRKYDWAKSMYAHNLHNLYMVDSELRNDAHIGAQDIIYRQYVPLVTYAVGINGIRYTNEWRFFCYCDKILSYGYYWSTAAEKIVSKRAIHQDGVDLATKIAKIVGEKVNFFVLDIAEKEAGGWTLIEVNDGTMSGLSENNPQTLYWELRKCFA